MIENQRILSTRFRKRLVAAGLIAAAGLLWGLALWQLDLGRGLRLAAYDIPFLMGSHPPPQEIVLVHIDEASHQELGQPLAQAWDRSLHTRMVEELTGQGAGMIVFDILFYDENPQQDEGFASAMREHGKVILAAEIIRNTTEAAELDSLLLPNPTLRRAAAGWGLTYLPLDLDGVARRVQAVISTPFGDKPSLAEVVRMKYTGENMQSGKQSRLINYYGNAGTFTSYSYAGVLAGRGLPAGAFKDKIVVIGAKQQAGTASAGKDMFATPYTPVKVLDRQGMKSRQLTSGMEIQATAMGNLLDGRRIRQMDARREFFVMLAGAILLAGVTCLFSPLRGISLAVLSAIGIATGGILFQLMAGYHFPWTIPALGQMPMIVVLSLLAHYLIEYSARWKLRNAFKSYMSAEQARQIDEGDVSLELGGKEVEATVLFSDLAGFTSLSEGLPPQAVSKALINYFETTTDGILENEGTIIKYVGDAVIATWGAPLKGTREADRAIDAAIQMQVASAKPISLETTDGVVEQVLETRIGINTGLVLAGNLGSSRRFDYTVIGDTVNSAARLEGLNKMLGTSILVAESVIKKCEHPERFLTRRMGNYVVKGRKNSISVYEILGYSAAPAAAIRQRSAVYLELYQKALAAFESGDLETAGKFLTDCTTLHDRLPDDPASRLMIDTIRQHVGAGSSPAEWLGQIVLDSK
ncbi:MAG: CHASE2 domain-containing protein [Luteolibacter sp.]